MSGSNSRVRKLQHAYSTRTYSSNAVAAKEAPKRNTTVLTSSSQVSPYFTGASMVDVGTGGSMLPKLKPATSRMASAASLNGRSNSTSNRSINVPRNGGTSQKQKQSRSISPQVGSIAAKTSKSAKVSTGKSLIRTNPNVNWSSMFVQNNRTRTNESGHHEGRNPRSKNKSQRKTSTASVDMIFNAMREIETGSFGSRSRTPRFSQDLSPKAFLQFINSLNQVDRDESLLAMFRNLKQYRSLLEVTALISVELDSRDALKQIINSTYSVLSAERVTLFLVNQQEKSITMVLSRDDEQVVFPIGQGLAGTVAETHEVLVIEDAYSDKRFDSSVDKKTGFKTRNMIVLPILDIYGECTAVLQCINRLDDSGQHTDFRKEDSFLLQIVGASAGHCIHKLRATEEAMAQQEKTSVLLSAMKAIQSEGDVNELIERLIAVAYDMMRCDRITLYLCDKSRKELWCAIISPDTVGFRIPYGVGIAGTVAETGEMLNVKDAYEDERFIRDVDICTGYRTRSILAMPIMDGGDVVGVLQLINKFADSTDDFVLSDLNEEDVQRAAKQVKRKSIRRVSDDSLVGSGIIDAAIDGTLEQLSPHAKSGDSVKSRKDAEKKDDTLESKKKEKSLHNKDPVQHKSFRSQSNVIGKRSSHNTNDEEYEDDNIPYGITTFSTKDVNLCESFCSEIGAALRRKVLEVRFKKVIADLGQGPGVSPDGSQQLIKSLLSTHTSSNVESKLALGKFTYAFWAIGKFRLKLKRIRGPTVANESIDDAIKNIDVALIMTRTLPNQAFDESTPKTFPEELREQSAHQKEFSTFTFDVLQHQGGTLVGLCNYVFQRTGLITRYRIQSRTMLSFLLAVKSAYLDKPYHNFHHACFVFQQVFAVMINTTMTDYLLFQDILVLLISAICHDIGHPGNTNDFEIKTKSELSITYNDVSVLEHHHAATTFRILSTPSNNILSRVSEATYVGVRKGIIHHILSTDMKLHFDLVRKTREDIVPADHSIVRGSVEFREKFGAFVLHCCDIGAQCMPVEVATKWGARVIQEFVLQAEKEKLLNLEPTPHMHGLGDPKKHSQVQVGFIEYIVKPAIEVLSELLPECSCFLNNLEANIERYRMAADGFVPNPDSGSKRDTTFPHTTIARRNSEVSSTRRRSGVLQSLATLDNKTDSDKKSDDIEQKDEEAGEAGFRMRGRIMSSTKSKSTSEAC